MEKLCGSRLNGYHFRPQQIIDGFIVDFYCHVVSLVIEVDGEIHDYQMKEDQLRDQVFRDKGLKVLRFKNEEIQNNLNEVLQKILDCCKTQESPKLWIIDSTPP